MDLAAGTPSEEGSQEEWFIQTCSKIADVQAHAMLWVGVFKVVQWIFSTGDDDNVNVFEWLRVALSNGSLNQIVAWLSGGNFVCPKPYFSGKGNLCFNLVVTLCERQRVVSFIGSIFIKPACTHNHFLILNSFLKPSENGLASSQHVTLGVSEALNLPVKSVVNKCPAVCLSACAQHHCVDISLESLCENCIPKDQIKQMSTVCW